MTSAASAPRQSRSLRPRLLQLGAGRGNARLQLGHALSIGAFPRRGPLQLDSRGVGAILRLLASPSNW